MASSLVSSIDSLLPLFDTDSDSDSELEHYSCVFEVMIELRNLKVCLIIGSRKLGDSHFMNSSSFSTLQSLFSRTQNANASLPRIVVIRFSKEIHRMVKQVEEEVYTALSGGPLLTVDDVVAIADSILVSSRDFPLALLYNTYNYRVDIKTIDGFVEEIQFLRKFLVFANCTGAQLNNLLILIQPIVISTTRVFVRDKGTETQSDDWIDEVQSKCSKVNCMVTKLQIYDAYSQALSSTGSHYAGVDDDILMGFLDSLISLLWDVLRHSDSRPVQFIVLYERLRFCRAILKQQLTSFDRKIKERIGGLMRDSGSLICSLRNADSENDLGPISDLLRGFDFIEAEIHNKPAKTSKFYDLNFGDHYSTSTIISNAEEKDIKVHEDTQVSSHQPQQIATPQVAGFQDDEVQTVLDRLTRGSNQLRIIPIYGMAGIGKTTFALKLYNHRSTMYHFQARASCTISQVLDKKKLLVQLLNQIHESGSYSGMTMDDLEDALRKRLKGRRYLILLDDVWSLEVWSSLKMSFPDDCTQSRIILTSRNTNISPHGLVDQEPYSLRLRDNHECLEILQLKLCHEEGWNSDIGVKIAKLCKGLPLVAVVVSGLLASVKQEGWKGILDELSSHGLSHEEQCMGSLELSYKHLPDDLKLCFLYIGALPEDEKFSVGRLIRLWMAEGFVKNNELKTTEDVGREYLKILIHRSLVMVAESGSIGGAKSCQIHDVIRDFCMKKARQENSFHILHSEIELLTRLTYLSVKSEWTGVPYSICNLSNLETLFIIFRPFRAFSFPDTLWNLQKLKYLKLSGGSTIPSEATVFSLPIENLESSSNVSELETLSGIQFKSDGSMEKQLRKFSNIRKLKCKILSHVLNSVEMCKMAIPKFLNQLQSLYVHGEGKLQCEIGSTQKLRKVTLGEFELSREEISVIGKLPNLRVLKLLYISFQEGALEMEEGDFSKLEVFHLTSSRLTRWTASDEQLPNLQKLVFRRCAALEEIPSTCLESCMTLEEIQVHRGCSTLESLVRDIEAVHEDFGNFIKVIISYF